MAPPYRPCLKSGCPELIPPPETLCTQHKREKRREKEAAIRRSDKEHHKRKIEDHKFYCSAVWRRLRLAKLRRSPLCERCGKAANVIDHIKRIGAGGERTDYSNLQSLCDSCHNHKRGREAWGEGE